MRFLLNIVRQRGGKKLVLTRLGIFICINDAPVVRLLRKMPLLLRSALHALAGARVPVGLGCCLSPLWHSASGEDVVRPKKGTWKLVPPATKRPIPCGGQ